MDRLKDELVGCGMAREALDSMDEGKLKALAHAMGINVVGFLPRDVRIVTNDKNGARYVVTDGFAVPKYKNKRLTNESTVSRNLYLRVEAIDQAIEDLLAAKGMLGSESK